MSSAVGRDAVKFEVPQSDSNRLALDRTVLANERTFLAWLRTGLTSLVAGLGVAKFLKDMMPLSMLLVVATIFILFGAVAFILGAWRYTHLHLRMEHLDIDAMPTWMVKIISIFFAGCSILALIGIVIMAM